MWEDMPAGWRKTNRNRANLAFCILSLGKSFTTLFDLFTVLLRHASLSLLIFETWDIEFELWTNAFPLAWKTFWHNTLNVWPSSSTHSSPDQVDQSPPFYLIRLQSNKSQLVFRGIFLLIYFLFLPCLQRDYKFQWSCTNFCPEFVWMQFWKKIVFLIENCLWPTKKDNIRWNPTFNYFSVNLRLSKIPL